MMKRLTGEYEWGKKDTFDYGKDMEEYLKDCI